MNFGAVNFAVSENSKQFVKKMRPNFGSRFNEDTLLVNIDFDHGF